MECDEDEQIALHGLIKARYNTGEIEEAWKHFEHVRKLKADLAVVDNDLIMIESDFKLNLGIRLRESGKVFKANELFYDVFKKDKKALLDR